MWRALGTLQPSNDWKLLSQPTFSETFRISYSGIDPHFNSKVLIRQYFANDEVARVFSSYPKKEKLVLEIAIPEDFKADGLFIRYLGVRRVTRNRYGLLYPPGNWKITIEEWI